MKPTDTTDDKDRLVSAMVYYFMEEDGSCFKSLLMFQPYFLLATAADCEEEIKTYLQKKYTNEISHMETIVKEDLELDNHLTGLTRTFVKVSFYTSDDLMKVRKDLLPHVNRNKKAVKEYSAYNAMMSEHLVGGGDSAGRNDAQQRRFAGDDCVNKLVDLREHDVPYHVRVAIDRQIFVGHWYDVRGLGKFTSIAARPDIVDNPEPVVLAFDIETTKLPLKFPDSAVDHVIMISYMIDGRGFLICNREIISEDIHDFEFTPKPEFPGPFVVFNEPTERRTLQRFFEHIREVRPQVFVTYNGDFFDWPFVERRAMEHGLDMAAETGFVRDAQGEYKARSAIHMDCFKWVQRDSYLPIGAQGLKAVCRAKLRYDPVEVDPEEMCAMARDDPRSLANYSVSDAVATFYLYMKYVQPFIFALCTIIPLDPDEVLRKGSGTLCECLLMEQAFRRGVVFPNKTEARLNALTSDGHLLESETYVGGHVEAIEAGVFRADIPMKFRVVPEMVATLREELQATLTRALEVEEKLEMRDVTDFDAVLAAADEQLSALQRTPNRVECPRIYHLDVAAMYPNIILSNRLQPSAIVTPERNACATCDFNAPNAACQRPMQWKWRAEIMPAKRSEFLLIQSQLEKEQFPPARPGGPQRRFYELDRNERAEIERDRLGKYCRVAYKRRHDTRIEERTSVVCQKENSFYVDTVRAFRDRRYEFKDLTKQWKKRVDELVNLGGDSAAELKRANALLVVYDSLQLAHKCILNSFYGYVMRRGARWYSMEMAGIVCLTGAAIIKRAREIIEQVGRPLELDTDGIWCALPAGLPDNLTFRLAGGKRVTISYAGAVLNAMVQRHFTNEQYHELEQHADGQPTYRVRSENSIFFEVDGPYRAMILPAAREQGKRLKKRYAVFHLDGTLAELKGFEVKRNGELNLIKIFQSSVFEAFLRGNSLQTLYASVATVADYWLDVLQSRGASLPDEELFELLSEKRCMSRKLADYGVQKSTSLSTARRLAEFLGDEMVRDAGLSFKFIISRRPVGLQVTERAIPVAIFQADDAVRRHFLARWLQTRDDLDDIRAILDWDYYVTRFSSNIQKIITIPAALQHVPNPVPRVAHPDWLHNKLMEQDDKFKQQRIDDMFRPVSAEEARKTVLGDIEDCVARAVKVGGVGKVGKGGKKRRLAEVGDDGLGLDKDNLPTSWREHLGAAPPRGETRGQLRLWLAFHRRKWALQAVLRTARDNKENARAAAPVKRARTTLAAFVTRTRLALLEDTWQLIQLAETATPGTFRLWVLVGAELHCLRLVVPRTFYVNTRLPKDVEDASYYRKVSHKLLPRSHVVHHLYRYDIDEPTFLRYETDITDEFVRNEVEGLYELRVPLLFRAITTLGCLCVVEKKQRDRENEQTFQLADLRQRSLAQHAYLDGQALRTVFLFQHRSGRSSVIALFLVGQQRAHIHLVEQARASLLANELQTRAQAIYGRERSQMLADGAETTELPSEELQIITTVSGDSNDAVAWRAVQKLLQTHRQDVRAPTLVLTACQLYPMELCAAVPILNEFPLVPLSIDNDTAQISFGVLDWQRVALRVALRGFLRHQASFTRQLDRARYLHVPVGNVASYGSDARGIVNSCDLQYARQLMKHEHALWASQSPQPDFGGKETADRRMLLPDNAGGSVGIGRNRPGCYDSVTVELELSHVAMSAVLGMHKLSEMDASSDAGRLFDTTVAPARPIADPRKRNLNVDSAAADLSAYDDVAAARPALRILRSTVLAWVTDVWRYRNAVADEHIVGFCKWLRSPVALLHDPALYRSLQKLMQQLLFKLLEALGGLGLDVVCAGLDRLVVSTRRGELTEALARVDHAMKTVKQQELFAQLDFQYVKSWELLLWQDAWNYSGVRANTALLAAPDTDADTEQSLLDHAVASSQQSDIAGQPLNDDDRVDINWHLARYLSPASSIQIQFMEIVKYYMLTVWRIARDKGTTGPAEGKADQRKQDNKQRFLEQEMTYKLYSLVSQMSDVSRLSKEVLLDDNDDTAPLLPLKEPLAKYPLVDLAKTICYVRIGF